MVWFTAENLSDYSPGRWLVLREKLDAFLRPTWPDDRGAVAIPGDWPPIPNKNAEGPSQDELLWTQEHLQNFLRGFVDPPVPNERGGFTLRGYTHSHFPLRDILCTAWETPRRLTVHGPYKDCVLFVAGSLLSDPQADDIKSCPVCSGLFMRKGKQVFWSTR